MSLGVLEFTGRDVDADVRRIGELNAVGALADEVLADLIKTRAGVITAGNSRALHTAHGLFEAAVEALERPLTADRMPSQAASLHRMAPTHAWLHARTVSESSSDGWHDDLRRIADSLAAVIEGTETAAQTQLLRAEFTQIAAGTMDASYGVLRTSGDAASWLTA